MTTSLVAEWDNFYVIMGSSAGGLTGLTFVVIALASDSSRVNSQALRAYVTPIVVHFGVVLGLAAYLSMPHQDVLTLSLGIGVTGAGGLVYVAVISVSMENISKGYAPVLEDWIWNAVLPGIAYGVLFAAALLIWRRPEPCMYGLAAVSLLLLFIGIHNAWDIAVWNTVHKKEDVT
jgi:hypothetical protein